jgi:hypothetical protein
MNLQANQTASCLRALCVVLAAVGLKSKKQPLI